MLQKVLLNNILGGTAKMLKKILLLMLIPVITLSLFASCSSESGDNNNESVDNTQQNNVENETEPATTERIYPDLEPVNFEGYEFTFLTRTINDPDWAEWNHRDLYAEEMTGDAINDAVYTRNRKIEEKYNIKFTEITLENPHVTTRITQAVRAGDDIFDAVGMHIIQFPSLAQNGNFIDLFTVPNLDLEKAWWDQGTVRDLAIIGKLFIIQGDLLVMDNDAMEAMVFNKRLHQEFALENLYDIVKKGEWTFDVLLTMSKGVSQDLNGDGQMWIKDDRFGCILQADTGPSFLVSGGEKIASKDASDYPVVSFGSERGYRITDYLTELMLDEENVVHLHRYEGQFGIYNEQVKMMEEDRALFSWIRMRIVERLRGMETDFGILPLPKLDKDQANYFTHNNPHTGVAVAIPVTASNLERTGMILEDLCAESRYTVQPAYYEVNLRGKYARDDESQEMLDIILSNTAHDIGYIYNFGGFSEPILRHGQNKRDDYVSAFERVQERMQRDIEKLIESYENLD
jgi:hypothetical protein